MIYTFDKIYDRSKRPSEYGKVTLLYERTDPGSIHSNLRPVRAYGLIYPLSTTKGRKSAPEPKAGLRIGVTKRPSKKAKAVSPRNAGLPDLDKGHIIALELGGPDVPENICPQWSHFQRSGEWREMEKEALKFALKEEENGNMVHMIVWLHYTDARSYKRSRVPSGFRVELRRNGPTGALIEDYDIDNIHNDTDDKMSWRIFAKIEPLDPGEDEETLRKRHRDALLTPPTLAPSPAQPGFHMAQQASISLPAVGGSRGGAKKRHKGDAGGETKRKRTGPAHAAGARTDA